MTSSDCISLFYWNYWDVGGHQQPSSPDNPYSTYVGFEALTATQTTWRCIPEDSILHVPCSSNRILISFKWLHSMLHSTSDDLCGITVSFNVIFSLFVSNEMYMQYNNYNSVSKLGSTITIGRTTATISSGFLEKFSPAFPHSWLLWLPNSSSQQSLHPVHNVCPL